MAGSFHEGLERIDRGKRDERESHAALAGDREVRQRESLSAAGRAGLLGEDVVQLRAELAVAHAVAAILAGREAGLLAVRADRLDDRESLAGVAGRRRDARGEGPDAALALAGGAFLLGLLAPLAG